MQNSVLHLQMSSDDAFAIVAMALDTMSDVQVEVPRWDAERMLQVTVEAEDPDVVDIVRALTWEFDPLAVQRFNELPVAS